MSIVLYVFGIFWLPVSASTRAEELKTEISSRAQQIAELERDIERQQAELEKVGEEKRSLERDVKTLDLSRNKLNTNIQITEQKISSTNLSLEQIRLEIYKKEEEMSGSLSALKNSLRKVQSHDNESLLERLLVYNAFSDFLNKERALDEFQVGLANHLSRLRSLRNDLSTQYDTEAERKVELVQYQRELSDQKHIVEINKREKSTLLTYAKTQASTYASVIEDRLAQKESLERELADFEAQLKVEIDPKSLPTPGVSVLAWPLKTVRITQLFGGTQFAASNSSIYGGRAYHPGVDFGASQGTAVHAPLSGVISYTGNTDAVKGCYSWGKWILLEHANGLTTFYTHLSLVSVSPSDVVKTGQVIGYTGNTGITTGPHLHFSVYATQGLSVRDFSDIKKTTNCAGTKTPTAPFNAQLDPMLYLPQE